MMQQQLYQHEQPGSQDTSGHQMVLCPVRVVYETPMLVQQGEQVQPNQTIFLNPQNPPPWIQNRPVQNQVIYVQHVPTNYVLPTQQHIDPNQLYIQNYNYQNMPQMLVQNPQEQIRPMQIPQQHMNQGSNQPGIGQNVQTQRLVQNITAMPNTLNLVNTAQNQNNFINRQITHNQITNINEIVANVKQENVGQNIYRQLSQTLPQDPRNQMQQTVTLMSNNTQRQTNMYEQNINQIQQIPQQNIANIQNYPNTVINIQETRKPPAINKNVNYNVVHPNISVRGQQSFRPIQPRTNQIRNNGPQYVSAQSSNNLIQSIPNMMNKNVPRKIASINQMTNTIAISNNGRIEGTNIVLNRKRKSESPDDIHKKISISNSADSPIIIKRIENVLNPVSCSDVGVNTSPIHRSDGRITINNLQITPLNPPNNQNAKIKEELAKKPLTNPIKEPQNVVRNNFTPTPIPITIQSEKDKLIRNTVYTQARGRVLNDKQTIVETNKPEISNTMILNTSIATVSDTNQKQQTNDAIIIEKIEDKVKSEEPAVITCPITISPIIVENKVNTEEVKATTVINDKVVNKSKLKEDRDFILTHVLDGYVIQESNIAFPIRKPLKEKTLPNYSDESETKESKEAKTDKDSGVKNNSKILNISHLHIKDIETIQNSDTVEDIVTENPFQALQPSVVKTWTAEQLENHLSNFGWNDTVSVLQEHEIDGESLLLVSKGQLLAIGIKEEHAEIISLFVKS